MAGTYAGKTFRPMKVKLKKLSMAEKIKGASIRPGGVGFKLAKRMIPGMKL